MMVEKYKVFQATKGLPAKLEQNGIYGYPTPETGARVLSHLVRYSEYLRESSG